MKLSDLSLLLLRLSISYLWLSAGISKLLNPQFITTFPNILEGFVKSTPYDFYSTFLKQYIVPNSSIFAQLTVWGEVLTGVAFFLGFPLILATIAGIFMNLNYYFVANSAPSQFVNIILIFSQFAAYANGAGNIWGLSAKFGKK